METLVGLVAFSVGLGLFVFPGPMAAEVLDGREAGHRATVAVRAVGLAAMAAGFALLVV